MATTDVSITMMTIADPSCLTLHESLESHVVTSSDPEEDINWTSSSQDATTTTDRSGYGALYNIIRQPEHGHPPYIIGNGKFIITG